MRPRWPAPTVCRWPSCCRWCCAVRPPGGLCVHLVDRWRPPAASVCTWIALRLAELQQLVVRLVAARWSGHAAELAGADGLHWIALQVAELLSLVPRRVAARPGTARMLAGAGGLQVPMVKLACGRQADRWRAPAAPACTWIALRLAELQQLVVHLVAARCTGHAAELAGADGLQVDRAAAGRAAVAGGAPGCRQVARPCGRGSRRRRSAGGRAAAAGAAPCGHPVGCACTWSTDGGHQPRRPAGGSRCG